jgi:hypothetical protein
LTCPSSPADKEHTGNYINSGINCPSGSTAGGTVRAKDVGTYYQTCTPDGNHYFQSTCRVQWKIKNSTCINYISCVNSCGSCPGVYTDCSVNGKPQNIKLICHCPC